MWRKINVAHDVITFPSGGMVKDATLDIGRWVYVPIAIKSANLPVRSIEGKGRESGPGKASLFPKKIGTTGFQPAPPAPEAVRYASLRYAPQCACVPERTYPEAGALPGCIKFS